MSRSRPAPTLRSIALALALSLAGQAGAAWAKEASKTNTATYTSFDALTATIWRPDGRRGVITVQAGLDVKDPGLRARAQSEAPILRDAYVTSLNVYAAALTPGAPPDVDQIALRLQQATDRVLKKPGARLLLGAVLVN